MINAFSYEAVTSNVKMIYRCQSGLVPCMEKLLYLRSWKMLLLTIFFF